MCRSRTLLPTVSIRAALVAAAVLAVASLAPVAEARDARVPERFAPALDSGLVELESPVDGRLWSAWVYRNGSELDVAVSALDADGSWSDPVLLGADDGRDQMQPALAVDPAGTVYVVFADRSSGALMLSALGGEAATWSVPVVVRGARGTAPAIAVLGDMLVIGYRDGERTRLVTRPLGVPAGSIGTHTIYDGPDPVGSCAEDGSCPDDSDDQRRQPRADAGEHDPDQGVFTLFDVPDEVQHTTGRRGSGQQH